MSEATQQSSAPQLNVSDLQLVLNLIELTSQRGTFKGAELSAVGSLYDRLSSFVTLYTEQQKTADSTDVDTSTESAGE